MCQALQLKVSKIEKFALLLWSTVGVENTSCLLGNPFLMLKAEFSLDGHCWPTNKSLLMCVESEIYTGLLQVTF